MDPERKQEIYQHAQARFESDPNWVDFFREVLGLTGKMRQAFKGDDLLEFQRSPEYRDILKMLATLRKKKPIPGQPKEEERVITVRLPKSMHELLAIEAHERRTTVNKLCISKLLLGIEQQLIPAEIDEKKRASEEVPQEATA